MKGSYLLLIKINKDIYISIGKLGNKLFKKGYYVYIGSALNNIEKRIIRHQNEKKKIFWHIDYLLAHAKSIKAFYKENNYREECNIVNQIEKSLIPIIGFGCSDCKCKSHLFYGKYEDIINAIENFNMNIFNANT
jgi:Uri superfamily endonuclease